MNTCDYLLEAARPGDVAVIDGARSYSYGDLITAAGQVAAHLHALDLTPGSRVAIVGPNSFFWVASYLAAMKLDLVAVPVSVMLTPEEARRNADWVQCRAILIDRRQQRRFGGAFTDEIPVITEVALESDGSPYWPISATNSDSDAALMFTSGTTSRPKSVRVTHRNIQANTDSIVEYLGLRRDDRMLVILPFYYCYGASLLHTHLRVGGRLVLCHSFAFPETALDMIEKEECTGVAGVPSSFQLLLRISSLGSRPLPSLRLVQQAGGKLPPAQIEELVQSLPNAEVFVMYGQTEATARLSYLPPELVRAKAGSIGRGIPGVELRVVDEEDRPVAPGEVGEIVACGDNVSPGYVGDPEATVAKFPEGELRTGDLATVDGDGFIYIVDRKDDFIKTWGYRVSSQEVEACALEMGSIIAAAAIGVPDSEAGEAVTLFATVRPGAVVSERDVLEFSRKRLAKHMVPKAVHLIDEMPLNANGKTAKNILRQWAVAGVGS